MREPDWIARAIALVEIVGGAIGVGLICTAMRAGGEGWFFLALFMAVYIWSIVAGVKLWRERDCGWRHSIAIQLLQVPWIITARITYLFCSGPAAWFGFGSNGLANAHSLFSQFNVGWASGFGPEFDARPWQFSINLVALSAAVYLWWRRRHPVAGDIG
jgi:hypothetical protein